MLRLRSIFAHNSAPARRSGLALIYLMVMLTVLSLFASLAVDWGRVQMAKTKLMGAVSSAAAAAASSLAANGSISAARAMAVQYASANTADGSAVVVDPNNDITFGTWNAISRTFTAGGGSPNAVRVQAHRTGNSGVPLMFASVLGRTNCNTNASAIATYGQPAGFLGINESWIVAEGGDVVIDSYDSSAGSYGGANVHSNAAILSNGWNNLEAYNQDSSIPVDGHVVLNGLAAAHPPGSVTTYTFYRDGSVSGTPSNGYVAVTKGTVNLNTALPALVQESIPGSNDNVANLQPTGCYYDYGGGVTAFYLGDGSSRTLPGGTYVLNAFAVYSGSTLTFTGPTHIYVNQSCVIQTGGQVRVVGNRPSDLKISTFTSASGWSYQYVFFYTDKPHYADVYAPAGLAYIYPEDINGNRVQGEFFGRFRADAIQVYGSALIHYDESFGIGQTGNVQGVQ